ncbi:(2Fe-2S)-binding protein [Halobacteriales archaeon QS_4_62_28]|nr:MAG: (2Fe-2S)-binding protein [Halobacteriales archaeon QS_4_62_28]
MVDPVSVAVGAVLTLVVVAVHYTSGTGWEPSEDISQSVIEQRASTVPETEFPEPYNRSIGGGGGTAAIPAGEGGAELEEGEEEEDEGFDPSAIAEDEVEHYEIEYAKEGETIEVANNETILDAGEDEGWDLPYACRQGQCVSCSGQIQDGNATERIRHSNNEALFEDDLEDGYCLTCVAYPTAEFTIETGEQP